MLPKTIDELAKVLGVTACHLSALAETADLRYQHRRIPKPSGGQRRIDEPDAELKKLQRELLDRVLCAVPLHPAATAFHRGASVAANAARHTGKSFVFSTDLVGFFASVTQPRVIGLLAAIGASQDVAELMARLACHRGRLPQGAPTSPVLANLVANKLDVRLSGFCGQRGWAYSRYADDLTISGHGGFTDRDRAWIERCIAQEGFEVNDAKTRLSRRGDAQVVTGIVVNEGCRLRREHRKRLRAIFHQAEQDPAAFKGRIEELRGHVAWLRSVEPQNCSLRTYEAVLSRLVEGNGRLA